MWYDEFAGKAREFITPALNSSNLDKPPLDV